MQNMKVGNIECVPMATAQRFTTTLNLLRQAGACEDSYRYLVKSLGGTKFDHDAPINLRTILEHNGVWDVEWVLGGGATVENCVPLWDEYERQCAPLWDEYQSQHAPLWAEYERQHAPLWAEYERQHAPLWGEYQSQRATLLAALLLT